MDVEQTKKMVDSAVEDLAVALEQGRSNTLKAYLAAMGRFHRYSLGNAMLIALQREDATRVAGFHTWKRLGRRVRKGERGIAILAPIARRKKRNRKPKQTANTEGVAAQDAKHSKTEMEESERAVVGFRTAYVFDVSQTDGKPLPMFAAA